MPNVRVRLGQLRKIKLPPKKDNESDLIASIRINQESHRPDKLVLYVPAAMAEMIPQDPPKTLARPSTEAKDAATK